MIRAIVLDSTPLGLLVRRPGFKPGDDCRDWLKRHSQSGVRFYVPAIIAYELRRELIRLGSASSEAVLDNFIKARHDRYLLLTDAHLKHAAQLWADARKRGRPTADKFALDIDVILAAQALSLSLPAGEFVVATENVAHLSLFVPAQPWQSI